MNIPISNRRSPRNSGFTLPELLIALLVVSLLSAGLIGFMLDVARGIFWGTEKAEISEDVRSFTMRLAAEARSSNTAVIYPSFATEDRDTGGDRCDDDESGDCLVLFTREPYPDADSPEHYTSAIIYFRSASNDETGVGPVYRIKWEATTPSQYVNASDKTLEELLTQIAPTDEGDHQMVIELSRGVADGRLFYNYRDTVAIVNGEILHGNTAQEVTNTYNLSISPRG